MNDSTVTLGGVNPTSDEGLSFFISSRVIMGSDDASKTLTFREDIRAVWPGEDVGRLLSLDELIELGKQQTLQLLNELSRLEADWDTYGSEPPTGEAIAVARELIEEIHQELRGVAGGSSLPFAVVPLSGGGVQLDWRGENDSIEVEIGPRGELGYLLARGAEPAREFEEGDGVSRSRVVELISSAVA